MTGSNPKYKYNRKARKRMRRHIKRRVDGWEITLGVYTADIIQSITPKEVDNANRSAHK